ncbi:MAG: RodZ domain-containing protein [Terriglobales bacterium]
MPSFGEKLKLEREKRKITLEEISSSTKIGTRMLQALEEEKFNQLPGGIFNKGFVRAYARVLGLDEDQAVADYLQASGEAAPVGPEAPGRDAARENAARETEQRINRLEAISDSPSRPLPWGAFAVVLLAVALALSLWSHRRREQERLVTHTPTAKPALQSAAAPPENSTSSTSTSGIQPSPVSATMNSAPGPAATSSEGTPSPGSQISPPTQSSTTPASGEFTVVVHARDQSWIAATVDSRPIPSETLEPRGERTFHGRREIVIKAGNVGALDFLLNGKKLDVGGDPGQVKTITIGPAGLLPNPLNPAANP